MDFPVGLGHMAGYLKGPQFPGHGPPALAGPFGLGHTLEHSPYGGKYNASYYPSSAIGLPKEKAGITPASVHKKKGTRAPRPLQLFRPRSNCNYFPI